MTTVVRKRHGNVTNVTRSSMAWLGRTKSDVTITFLSRPTSRATTSTTFTVQTFSLSASPKVGITCNSCKCVLCNTHTNCHPTTMGKLVPSSSTQCHNCMCDAALLRRSWERLLFCTMVFDVYLLSFNVFHIWTILPIPHALLNYILTV